MNTHDALIEFFLFFVPALLLWLINTALRTNTNADAHKNTEASD